MVLLMDGPPASTPGKSLPAIQIKMTVVAVSVGSLLDVALLYRQLLLWG